MIYRRAIVLETICCFVLVVAMAGCLQASAAASECSTGNLMQDGIASYKAGAYKQSIKTLSAAITDLDSCKAHAADKHLVDDVREEATQFIVAADLKTNHPAAAQAALIRLGDLLSPSAENGTEFASLIAAHDWHAAFKGYRELLFQPTTTMMNPAISDTGAANDIRLLLDAGSRGDIRTAGMYSLEAIRKAGRYQEPHFFAALVDMANNRKDSAVAEFRQVLTSYDPSTSPTPYLTQFSATSMAVLRHLLN